MKARHGFVSFLGSDIEHFLAHKRSTGRRYDVEEKTLRLLDAFLLERRIVSFEGVTPALIDEFLASRPRPRPRSYNHLRCTIGRLFAYLVSHGNITRTPLQSLPRRSRYQRSPYIFDQAAARRLLSTARSLADRGGTLDRGNTYFLIFAILYSRYRSAVLALIIMGSVPLALIGSVAALWIAGLPLSVASMIGFVTLTGIATRNGILKVSHYINLALHEGMSFGPDLVIRGTLERLTPVLMTALSACVALFPLLIDASSPGKEILHPVAVTIFGGLISATVLDAILIPVLFLKFGCNPLERLRASAPVALTPGGVATSPSAVTTY